MTILEKEKIEILIRNMVLEMKYEVKKMVFESFDTWLKLHL